MVRAAVLRQIDRPLTIEEVEVADPQPHEVLIDIRAVGLCHSDLKFIEGAFPVALPAVLGHEAAGVVRAVGDGVTRLRPGDHVLTALTVFCGDCVFCREGRTHLCVDKAATRREMGSEPRISVGGETLTQGFDLSAFSERILVHDSGVVAIEDDIPFETAALLGCGVATGLGAVFNTARVRPGDTVAVVGCGGVGLSCIQGAVIAGARQVIAVDNSVAGLELAGLLGATDTVGPQAPDVVEAVRGLTDGLGVDHAIEAVGSTTTAEQAFAMTRRGGTATIVGLIPSGASVSISGDDLFYERRIQGSVMGSNDFHRDTPRYLQLYRDGELKIDDMVGQRLSLEEINLGFDRMRAGAGGRSVIVFDR